MSPSQHFLPTPRSEPDDSTRNSIIDNNVSETQLGTKLIAARDYHSEHLRQVAEKVERLQILEQQEEVIEIDGDHLSIAELAASAFSKIPVRISQRLHVAGRVNDSVTFLSRHLDEGNVVYGINTGYGGSADTRSTDLINMQRGLIQHHNSAVLLSSDKGQTQTDERLLNLKQHALPRSVVRGAMLARCNSLLRGHSAVRLSVIENLVQLLNHDFVPVVPVRGSISASGDLTPLAYIAGALEGNSGIILDCAAGDDGQRVLLNAREALDRTGLTPTVMMAKESLGLMNGTAVSCAAASLALSEAQVLALASQVLTGMSTEALRGSADNFHPFISKARPHTGQIQVAKNVRRQIRGSKLVVGTNAENAGLFQDRYALRTAPQWIGPQLEDLMLAEQQVETELNSTTDNPLVDAEEGHVHHGGNFQAASVTSAMEKTRLALQMLGKLMFAQSSELINPTLNKHLTPNLSFDDPDVSFTCKGVDINMAAYMSELAYLANPVSSHVQSAEMHNQAVNSLALLSTRYTMDAIEVLSLMTATHLFAACQALDLHALWIEYTALIERDARWLFDDLFKNILATSAGDELWVNIVEAIRAGLITFKAKSTAQRAQIAADGTIVPITKTLLGNSNDAVHALKDVGAWTQKLKSTIEDAIRSTRASFAKDGPTTQRYLGHGSAIVYRYIRETLGVPLHYGLVEHPTYPDYARGEIVMPESEKVTIGTRIGVIYEALRAGQMRDILVESLS